MAATIINQQLMAAISNCEVKQEELAKEQAALTKKMASFQKKLQAAKKRSENCKKYIASLLQEERIVEIYSDEKILTGPVAYTHYVRSDSLNVYGGNYYYIVTMRRFCTCDGCQHTGRCKHVESLLDRLSDGEKKVKFAELKAQYDCRSEYNVWEMGPWQRVVETVSDKAVADETATRLTREGRFTHVVVEVGSQAEKQFQKTSQQRQEAPLAGASRGFSLYR